MSKDAKKVVLLILDGYGIAPKSQGNAITLSKTPTMDYLVSNYPAMTLLASGPEVGLPFGRMGDSEVGHANLGAGRVFYQNYLRISKAIADGSFFKNEVLLNAMTKVEFKKRGIFSRKLSLGKSLHIIGIVSEGGVHGHLDHMIATLVMAKQMKIKNVFVHIILDGRDAIYNSGKGFVEKLITEMKQLKVGKVASVCGRFYAMDRDNQWDRVSRAYLAMAEGKSDKYHKNPLGAIEESYLNKVYDEEFEPVVITDKDGVPVGPMADGDSVIFCNFRSDRARELTKAFVLPEFDKFERPRKLENLFFVGMMEYEKDLPVEIAFKPSIMRDSLGEVVSKNNLRQLRLAETQKFVHVTFFFNALSNKVFEGEDRVLVPSPRVDSFATKPEMSIKEVTKELLKAISESKYDLIICNFANADMVGHTGDLNATITAIETIDKCLKDVYELATSKNYTLLVTADHGNAEEMINFQTSDIDKEHSTNPVPFIVVDKDYLGKNVSAVDSIGGDLSLLAPSGVLSDVAPTVLKLMGLKKPDDMTGTELI